MHHSLRSHVREGILPFATAILAVAGTMLFDGSAHAAQASGSLALTSDYVWRGSTQTLGKPALQLGGKIASDAGFYAAAWGSNVDFGPAISADTEVDTTLGWGHGLGKDWAIDANVLRYNYPGARTGIGWNEVNVSTTWRDRAWIGIATSSNAMATRHSGTYSYAGVRIPAGERLRFELEVGHYALNDGIGDYNRASASAIWTLKKPLEFRITAHATDAAARRRFGDDNAGSRLEAALQTTF